MLDIDRLMASLAATRKVFHSEADFQHALAWHIHKAMPESQVRLEVDVLQVEHRRRFLDIWLPVEGNRYRIEVQDSGIRTGARSRVLCPPRPKGTRPKGVMISSGIFIDLNSCALS